MTPAVTPEVTSERVPRLLLLWLGVVLIAALIVSAIAIRCMTVRAALHEGGWLKSGDRIAASAEVSASNLQSTTAVIAKGVGPMMDSLNQGGVKLQMAMDSMQEAAEEVKDVMGNLRDDLGQALNLIGSGTKLVDHITDQVDKVHAEKIDSAIDAVRDLAVEGNGTEAAATTWMNAGTTAFTNAAKLLSDADPLVVNTGKISGDGYVYLHKVFEPG
jgi:methyl-accepting chemotaxis protein